MDLFYFIALVTLFIALISIFIIYSNHIGNLSDRIIVLWRCYTTVWLLHVSCMLIAILSGELLAECRAEAGQHWTRVSIGRRLSADVKSQRLISNTWTDSQCVLWPRKITTPVTTFSLPQYLNHPATENWPKCEERAVIQHWKHIVFRRRKIKLVSLRLKRRNNEGLSTTQTSHTQKRRHK